MASNLSADQLQKSKFFIYKKGRLLERKLFEYFYENGTKQACLKALSAYQNEDGGFGNGIEPDLLCPDSSAIGAETAIGIVTAYPDFPWWDPIFLLDGLIELKRWA